MAGPEPSSLTPKEAFSGIFGAISLASWVFLLLPQLYENYSTQSGAGVSILFLLIWALGDVFNLAGAIWADLVPTVIALALWFCISDSILILQSLYYRHWTSNSDNDANHVHPAERVARPSEALYTSHTEGAVAGEDEDQPLLDRQDSHRSYASFGLPGSHARRRTGSSAVLDKADLNRPTLQPCNSTLRSSLVNTVCVLAVCLVGALGLLICYKTKLWTPVPPPEHEDHDEANTPLGAEVLGYLSAVLYLGARIPQIIKNWREKSCEGLSLLFFLLSLLGNLTYGAGILAHSVDKRYVLTNIPWLLGSLGTVVEDVIIFIQFHLYRDISP